MALFVVVSWLAFDVVCDYVSSQPTKAPIREKLVPGEEQKQNSTFKPMLRDARVLALDAAYLPNQKQGYSFVKTITIEVDNRETGKLLRNIIAGNVFIVPHQTIKESHIPQTTRSVGKSQ